MASSSSSYVLSNLYPSKPSSSSKQKPINPYHQTVFLAAKPSSSTDNLVHVASPPAVVPLLSVETPPARGAQDKQQKDDFYLNLGLAVRTLREDLPLLFTKDLNYDIYRDDITFLDPLNTFTGIENYKLIFWALRFHGKVLFKDISVEIFRVWQPSENMILIRWNLRGVPRVPWEAKGQFQGTSRYKLDRNGKIYEHKVDNLVFNFPKQLKPVTSVLDLVTACPASPNPTFLWGSSAELYASSSWVEFYRAVRETLGREDDQLLAQDGLVACCS